MTFAAPVDETTAVTAAPATAQWDQ
jgi:hypothetical protein